MIDLPDPKWLTKLPKTKQEAARRKFRVRVAALYLCEKGGLKDLSAAAGLSDNKIATQPKLTPELSIKIEGILGRENFPREYFRPDIFLVKE